LKIGIDIRTINKPRSGVGYYVTNLIKEFQSIDQENDYCLISNNGSYGAEFKDHPNFHHCTTRVSNEDHIIGDLWESLYLPKFLERRGVQVFHGPAFMIPLRKGKTRTVVSIHDIVAYRKPETIPLKYSLYMKLLIRLVSAKADKIISPSLSTKNDLIERLGVPDEKIQVIYDAASKRFAPPGEPRPLEIKKKFGIRDRYMLFAGNLEPRKNLIRLMKAFDLASGALGDEYQLVICGKKGWLFRDILRTYEELTRDNRNIILTNYVSEDDLLKLYQCADMFVFPTLYEGFGLPPLEAMSCGVPLITSNVSSLPEIAGDAALLVDPFNTEEICAAMVKMATSEELRRSLREKGIRQAARFSWTTTAQQTLEAYRSVL